LPFFSERGNKALASASKPCIRPLELVVFFEKWIIIEVSDQLLCYSLQVKTAKLVAVLDIGFFGIVFTATTFAIDGLDMKIMIIGLICACLSVFMYGSPLTAVVRWSQTHRQIGYHILFCLVLYGDVVYFQKHFASCVAYIDRFCDRIREIVRILTVLVVIF
jgi:hypothetical protein